MDESELELIIQHTSALRQALEGLQFGDDLLADALFKQILILLSRYLMDSHTMHTEMLPRLVSDTFQFIEEHLTEKITLHTLEKHLHHNGTYISRCFKHITGISLQQYILAKKVTLAQKLLREGCSPNETCYAAGFNDYANFSRTFSKQTGISPRRYQQNWRKNM